MRRPRSSTLALLLLACMIGAALTRVPAHAAVEPEQLSEEELAEEAALADEAAEADPDAPGVAEEQEGEPVDEKDVLVLTDSKFDAAIKKHQYILVRSCLDAARWQCPFSQCQLPQISTDRKSPPQDLVC